MLKLNYGNENSPIYGTPAYKLFTFSTEHYTQMDLRLIGQIGLTNNSRILLCVGCYCQRLECNHNNVMFTLGPNTP